MFTVSFSTYTKYFFLKSFLSILEPVVKSTAFKIKAIPRHKQLTRNKNIDSSWKPYNVCSITRWRIAPIIKGNIPKAKFCIISIKPNAVPNSFGATIIGRVGMMTEQNRPIPIPIKVTGIHLIHSSFLITISV